MKLKIHATFLRFLIAGGFNTLFGWLIFSTVILVGAQPWLALIISYLISIGFNFITLGAYVFRDMELNRLLRFVLSYVAIYTTNLICMEVLKPLVENPIISQLILTFPLAILAYTILSKGVFRPQIAKNL
jgi:putative flippase GtrA